MKCIYKKTQRKAAPSTAIEGVILTTTAFEETAHILTLFSKEYGRVKCVTKHATRGLSPLLGVEALVTVGEKELWKCRECRPTSSYPRLRLQLQALRVAAKISMHLASMLPLHLPLPEIYAHFLDFLEWVPCFEKPHIAAVIFLGKFCINEGILPCSPLYNFTHEEIAMFQRLAHASFESLQNEREEVEILFEKLLNFVLR